MPDTELDDLVRSGWQALDGQTLRDRVRGALLGTALGDALGAPFEGTAGPGAGPFPAEQAGQWRYTDDTAMTLVLAEHLAAQCERGRGLDEDGLARAFAAAWQAEPWRGYGAGPPQIFTATLAGRSWRAAAEGLFGGVGSYGNGGAMRVAPVALLGPPVSRVLDDARRSAGITHAHPLGAAGAAVQAAAVALALASDPQTGLDRDRFLAALDGAHDREELAMRLDRVRELLGGDADPAGTADALGNGLPALQAVPAAIAAFLHAPDDPARVIEFAVAMGGDTDTIAAMAGAAAGARCGAAALPAEWRDRLEDTETIRAQADRVTACTAGSTPSRARVDGL